MPRTTTVRANAARVNLEIDRRIRAGHFVTGNTYPVRHRMRELGGLWAPAHQTWCFEDMQITDHAQAIVEGREPVTPVSPVPAQPAAAPAAAPVRRRRRAAAPPVVDTGALRSSIQRGPATVTFGGVQVGTVSNVAFNQTLAEGEARRRARRGLEAAIRQVLARPADQPRPTAQAEPVAPRGVEPPANAPERICSCGHTGPKVWWNGKDWECDNCL
jgi:hypothetical protein